MTKINKTNEHQDKGQCQICKKVDHTSIWKVFLQESCFRGEDTYLGKFCKKCNTKENIDNRIAQLKKEKPTN